MLFGCFALFLLFFSRFTGCKIIMSFVFTAVCLWKVLIPLYLKGYSPIGVAMAVVVACSAVILFLVGGMNKKGVVAFTGTIAGITVTAMLAILFGWLFKIPGTVQEYAEALLYTGFTHLKLSDIFIAGIFISSAGAVMDVSMDISASMNELITHTPGLTRKEMLRSGFSIATPVIGSMTTTLLFAYSGSFMFAFMAFMAKGVALQSIINSGFISAEILHTLVGSFGLVLVAPLTAIIGSYIYTTKAK
ncbi:MAG: YibE/F family protein [Tannerellaceae bacterium]|nr:YibE/F family protein [Tannerellaceae bacterium]